MLKFATGLLAGLTLAMLVLPLTLPNDKAYTCKTGSFLMERKYPCALQEFLVQKGRS